MPEGESENTLLRSALAVIFTALGGRLPTKISEAAAFALERLEQLTDLAADRDAAVARAEQAEKAVDELREQVQEAETRSLKHNRQLVDRAEQAEAERDEARKMSLKLCQALQGIAGFFIPDDDADCRLDLEDAVERARAALSPDPPS